MKVYAKQTDHTSDLSFLGSWSVFDYDHKRHAPCCDSMREAWDGYAVGFGDYDRMSNKDTNVNIYTCSPYPEGACWTSHPIQFCPFCAEAIEVEIFR